MKIIKAHLKIVALFFSVLILLQGCTVYKSANATLEEAVMSDTKVRIKTNDHQIQNFLRIGVENGNYYGLMYFKNTWVKTQINEDNIEKLQVKDKPLSLIITIGTPVILFGILFYSAFMTKKGV